MKDMLSFLRSITPYGLLERRRRAFQMSRLGLPPTVRAQAAVETCCFDLWPQSLRNESRPWTLVDVGANRGDFTQAVADLVSLSGVYAFEPQPSCHKPLSDVLNRIPNSHLYAVAVGEKCKPIALKCTSNPKLASILSPSQEVSSEYPIGDFDIAKEIEVPMVRLDDIIPENIEIGLMKIDVQGYEMPVLEGAINTLAKTNALLMEVNYVPHYEGGSTFDDLVERVRSLGFRTYGISKPYGGSNGPLWADAMFVRIS
jgi:FkbM family methyltransferase